MATIFTHNGTWTITSTRTGEHRTFQVRTQKPDAKFAPGERILSLLTGSDNTNPMCYTGFAFVSDDGIRVWRSKRGTIKPSRFEEFARMIETLTQHEAAGRVRVQAATTCRKCNRDLTDDASILAGVGPVCDPLAHAAAKTEIEAQNGEAQEKAAILDQVRYEAAATARGSLYATQETYA